MGNVETHDFVPVRDDERKELNLSRKMNPQLYEQHMNGEALPGSLSELPWNIVDSISLYERMDVSFNMLTQLPVELPLRLPHLYHLDLSHNHLTSLPHSFGLLFHLKTLHLNHNNLKQIPKSFIHLVKLEKLDLSFNELVLLPDELGSMEKLKKLNVSHNYLQALPTSLGVCKTLKVVLAINNKCERPPQCICDEGSEATMQYLHRQIHNGYLPRERGTDNVFKRVRGNILQSAVANPHSARAQYVQEQTHTSNTTSRVRTPLRPPLDATKYEADELVDKITGLIYGAAIGDAIGICTEHLSPDECQFHYDQETLCYDNIIQDKHRVRWQKGDWTVDFDQMILVLDSLLSWAGVIDELDFAQRLSYWCYNGFPELGDIGPNLVCNTIAKVVSDGGYIQDPHTVSRAVWSKLHDQGEAGCHNYFADNGAIVRAAILGIPQFHDLKEVTQNAQRICQSTHWDSRCQASSIAISVIIAQVLQGKYNSKNAMCIEEILDVAKEAGKSFLSDNNHIKDYLHHFAAKDFESVRVGEPNRQSYTFKPMAAAVAALRLQKDFRTVVSDLVMRGADSNSNACVVGALLGCVYGYSKLPKQWLDGLRTQESQWLNAKVNALLDMMGLP